MESLNYLREDKIFFMKPNMGKFDRLIRLLLAAVVIALYFTGKIDGNTAIILGIIAFIFIVTSFIKFCPLYKVLGIRTNQKG